MITLPLSRRKGEIMHNVQTAFGASSGHNFACISLCKDVSLTYSY